MEKAQVGDLIRVVDARPYVEEDYENGDIYEVIGRFSEKFGGVIIEKEDECGDHTRIFDNEYVIHRKAGEEDEQKTIRKGAPTAQFTALLHSGEKVISAEDARALTEQEALAQYQSEIVGNEADRIVEEPQADAVNHPNHYTQGRFETIEIIEEVTQGYSDGYVSYCVGNALKYLARAPFKHESPAEDIAKARAYLDFALKRLA